MNLVETSKIAASRGLSALRLGVRAHDFGCAAADELAARIAAQDFSCVQLALNKAIRGLNLSAGDLHSGLARDIGCAFELHGVGIEVLGCYINPIHPDLPTRRKLLEFFKDHLRFARDFGCGIVALESGSMNADYSPHPDNHGEPAFNEMLDSLAELVAEAEKHDVIVGFEAVHCHTVSTAQKMRWVLDTLRSEHLRVVFDAANLLSPENYRQQSRMVPEALDLLGDKIVVVHAKDFVAGKDRLNTVPAGRGELDFAPVLKFVAQTPSPVAVLLEEAGVAAAANSAAFLKNQFRLSQEDL